MLEELMLEYNEGIEAIWANTSKCVVVYNPRKMEPIELIDLTVALRLLKPALEEVETIRSSTDIHWKLANISRGEYHKKLWVTKPGSAGKEEAMEVARELKSLDKLRERDQETLDAMEEIMNTSGFGASLLWLNGTECVIVSRFGERHQMTIQLKEAIRNTFKRIDDIEVINGVEEPLTYVVGRHSGYLVTSYPTAAKEAAKNIKPIYLKHHRIVTTPKILRALEKENK